MDEKTGRPAAAFRVVSHVLPFVLITLCFALWGFANDVTNPMVEAFSKIFRMNVVEGSLVQVAFYGGYFAMAFPAALFIRRYSYKAGVLMGLGLYALGAFLFWPAKEVGDYPFFLLAYFVLTCGLSFLETTCNPYILSMGSPETATRRLNLAQSFNPIGSLCGMFVAMNFIQARLNPMDSATRATLDDAQFEAIKQADLSVLVEPYVGIVTVIAVIFVLMLVVRMPGGSSRQDDSIKLVPTLKRIFRLPHYREGVIAQFFYIGAQIMCWTFIIQYGTHIFMLEGMDEQSAEIYSQKCNINCMALFCISRFLCTFALHYLRPSVLLTVLAVSAMAFTLGVIGFQNRVGLYCLMAVSGCMSLMFPTIYGMSLNGMGEDAKLGAAGLIMAILGGSVLPPLQAVIIDKGVIAGFPAVNLSFVLPLLCFVVVAAYGFRRLKAQ